MFFKASRSLSTTESQRHGHVTTHTSIRGVFSDWFILLIYHSFSVAMVSRHQHHIPLLVTRSLHFTNGSICWGKTYYIIKGWGLFLCLTLNSNNWKHMFCVGWVNCKRLTTHTFPRCSKLLFICGCAGGASQARGCGHLVSLVSGTRLLK